MARNVQAKLAAAVETEAAVMRATKDGNAAQLADALAKLEYTKKALRNMQATMISERLERCKLERDIRARENKAQGYKEQLVSAAEALRRLKKEGQKTEQDRQRYHQAFEEAKRRYVTQL